VQPLVTKASDDCHGNELVLEAQGGGWGQLLIHSEDPAAVCLRQTRQPKVAGNHPTPRLTGLLTQAR
jgi:hypothetical protein